MRKIIVTWMLALCITTSAQQGYQPTPENLKNRTEFQDNKFGIFIHWGVYSMLASGEWSMNLNNINYKEYAKLASGFYPAKFNATEWVSTIKASGAKYICITSRHHDGFSMFNSKITDYNIVKASPFKRDILKELADECAKQDIKLHVYYSLIDWYREDAAWSRTGQGTGRNKENANWPSYFKFMNGQIAEILTNYGKIGALWFDGWWDQKFNKNFDWQLPELYTMIHKLQPECMIGNNHHLFPIEGEDFQMFERDLPGENKAGYSGQGIGTLPLETCETMNGMWGYKITDQNYKSTKTLIHYLVKAAGRNANLLMNIGPQPDGELPAVSVERLKEMGEWMKKYGETIYGTRGGIVAPHEWGVTTQKDDRLFVHILNKTDEPIFLPFKEDIKVKKAVAFDTKEPISFINTKGGTVLQPTDKNESIDYIIELKLSTKK